MKASGYLANARTRELNISVKGAPAPAGAGGIRIAHLKALAAQAVVKIDLTAIQILQARRIHQKGYPVAFQLMVIRLFLVKRHSVFKTGTAPRFHKNAELLPHCRLFSLELANLFHRTVSKSNHTTDQSANHRPVNLPQRTYKSCSNFHASLRNPLAEI